MSNPHIAAMRALYSEPTPAAIAAQLPAVASNLAAALNALAADPTSSRAGLVCLQLGGALGLCKALQQSIARAGEGHGDR